jgi:rhodanese-related sulfurtransferase
MPSFKDLHRLARLARQEIQEISPQDARTKVAQGALLIDVRDEDELLRNPPLAGALHLSRGRLEYLITDAVASKHDLLVLYCGGGNRGALAAASLQSLGYTQVFNIRGGLHAWRESIGQRWFPPRWEAAGGSTHSGLV